MTNQAAPTTTLDNPSRRRIRFIVASFRSTTMLDLAAEPDQCRTT
jgi:hypothetical protein